MSPSTYNAKIRLPGMHEPLEFRNDRLETFGRIEDYWMKREGVLFFPFDRDQSAFFLSNEHSDAVPAESPALVHNEDLSEEEYKTTILMAKHAMASGEFDKVVLARNQISAGSADAEEVFERAMELYPEAYCFSVDLGEEQWVGASPELLIRYADGELRTVALAGTRLQGEEFGPKEQEEQQMVEAFIEERLKGMGLRDYQKSEKQEVTFDQLKHLRTDYRVRCAPDEAMHAALVLHPTSAVCGLPRNESYAFIQELETMNRGFYAGMTGLLEHDAVTFFVNLRCLRIQPDRVELFAGAGITAESEADSEWDETQRKIQSISKLLP